MKSRIVWKLLAINVPVVGLVALGVWLAVDYLAAGYFEELMKRYHVSPSETHQMFVDSVHRYLIKFSVAAFVLGAILSFWLTRRVLQPLSSMAGVTRKIADGDYTARVHTLPNDEIGELGNSFNQMADSLARIEELRKTMAVDFAHELRTPLTNVRGYLEGLADRVIQPTKSVFDMLQEEIMRLVALVEDFQQLTKAEAADAYLRKEPIMLGEVVGRILDLYQYQLLSRNIKVETCIAAEAEQVYADRDKLLQVLRNLVQNASQYTLQGGTIRIDAAQSPEGVRVTVSNTGDGIEKEHLPSIFERFYRADRSRSRYTGGSGLGLAIVKGLIEVHGGRVGASSAKGRTEFWFTLPNR